MAGFVVVLDANVLYGIEVTDLLATWPHADCSSRTGRHRSWKRFTLVTDSVSS
jgi:hypothetical protein